MKKYFKYILLMALSACASYGPIHGTEETQQQDYAVISKILDDNTYRFQTCSYKYMEDIKSKAAKSFTISFTIMPSGATSDVEVAGDLSEKASDCILDVMGRIQFSKIESQKSLYFKSQLTFSRR